MSSTNAWTRHTISSICIMWYHKDVGEPQQESLWPQNTYKIGTAGIRNTVKLRTRILWISNEQVSTREPIMWDLQNTNIPVFLGWICHGPRYCQCKQSWEHGGQWVRTLTKSSWTPLTILTVSPCPQHLRLCPFPHKVLPDITTNLLVWDKPFFYRHLTATGCSTYPCHLQQTCITM